MENNTLRNVMQGQYERLEELSAMKKIEANEEYEHECDFKDFATRQFEELKSLVRKA